MTPCNEVETIHASQNDTSLRKWGIIPYDYDGNDITNQQDKATLVDIKGQTLKWNQIAELGNTDTTGGITVTNNRDGSLTINGTATKEVNSFPIKSSWVNGHIYMWLGIPTGVVIYNQLYKNGSWVINLDYRSNPLIRKITSSADANRLFSSQLIASGTSFNNVTYFPMEFDLTQMFGETKAEEILAMETAQSGSGIAYFKSLFPLDFYPYNSGSLIPFNGNGIKTVGKNLINYLDVIGIGARNGTEGVYGANTSVSGDELIISQSYAQNGGILKGIQRFEMKQGEYVTISGNVVLNGTTKLVVGISNYNGGGTNNINNDVIPTDGKFSITLDAKSDYPITGIFLQPTNLNSSMVIRNLMVERGSVVSNYVPYTESVINLPISTYFPSGMKQAGNVYDELLPNKAITRIGAVDLGTLTFNQSSNFYYRQNSQDLGIKADAVVSFIAEDSNITSVYYYGNSGQFRVYVNDISIAPSGMLYYELETETETDISPELDLTFNIDKGGTEELLPSSLMNGSVDLGSLTWRYESGWRAFVSTIADAKRVASSLNANWYCSKYYLKGSHFSGDSSADMTIDLNSMAHGDGTITIRDTSFNGDATAFTNSLQGVYLWYETMDNTPTTTPLNATVKYPAETKDVYFTYQVSDFLSTVFKFYLVTKGIQIPCELEDDTLVADCTSEISNEPGFFDCKIKAENDLGQIFSNKFQLHIERSPQ